MAVTLKDCRQGNYHEYLGVSDDDKPTNCAVNSLFHELDTDKQFYFDGTSWLEVGAGGK